MDEYRRCSEWGHDFRPSYARLGCLRDALPRVPIMALTATATPVVQRQVAETLKLHPAGGTGRAGSLVVKTSFNRPNLVYEVHGCAAG